MFDTFKDIKKLFKACIRKKGTSKTEQIYFEKK